MKKKYNHKNDWFYEGKISHQLIKYLKKKKYTIEKDNSDNCKAKGIDIIAISQNSITELIEVKGYPTEFYTSGENKGEKKMTNPKLQARHWFSDLLFSCFLNFGKSNNRNKKTILAIALPMFEEYIKLIGKVNGFFIENKINLKIYFIDKRGGVSIYNFKKKLF